MPASMDRALVGRFLRETSLLLAPSRPLSAYGPTRIRYHLVSPIDGLGDRTRLREGAVVSERPLILTPQALRERFQDFGEESRGFARWLCDEYQDLLRALEYRFRNRDFSARVIRQDPQAVAGRIRTELESRGDRDSLLIRCPDAAWSLALMKYALDAAARAFPEHVRSYEEHGLFDPAAGAARARRREIEGLFARAAADPSSRAELGRRLKDHGLFAEYEDRFLALF